MQGLPILGLSFDVDAGKLLYSCLGHGKQADAAAEQHLHRFNRSLCRQNAVVNQGHLQMKGVAFKQAMRHNVQRQRAEMLAMYDSDFD